MSPVLCWAPGNSHEKSGQWPPTPGSSSHSQAHMCPRVWCPHQRLQVSSQRAHFQTSRRHSWLQFGLICSKAMTLISFVSHTHLLNLPGKMPLLLLPPGTFSGSWMLMQKWSGRCLQPGGPYRCTITFPYRASKKSLQTKLCAAGHALSDSPGRVSKWEFQGLLSTVISQVNQCKSIWHWRLGIWNIWEDIFSTGWS